MAINKKYSYKSHKYQDLRGVDPAEFSDSTIEGASFYQRDAYTMALPDGVTNCILKDCNVDNCNLPAGYTLSGTSTNKHIKERNDKEKWVDGPDKKPAKPLREELFDKYNLSKNPVDIPEEMADESPVDKAKKIKDIEDEAEELAKRLQELATTPESNETAAVAKGAKKVFSPGTMTAVLSADGRQAKVEDLSGEWE